MAEVDDEVPPRPSPERLARLAELASWHDQWSDAALPAASFTPAGRPERSDYNQHHADVDSAGAIENAFHLGAQRIFSD